VAILVGMPADVRILPVQILADLKRRMVGYGRGARMMFDQYEL
jgi:chorismate synthase